MFITIQRSVRTDTGTKLSRGVLEMLVVDLPSLDGCPISRRYCG